MENNSYSKPNGNRVPLLELEVCDALGRAPRCGVRTSSLKESKELAASAICSSDECKVSVKIGEEDIESVNKSEQKARLLVKSTNNLCQSHHTVGANRTVMTSRNFSKVQNMKLSVSSLWRSLCTAVAAIVVSVPSISAFDAVPNLGAYQAPYAEPMAAPAPPVKAGCSGIYITKSAVADVANICEVYVNGVSVLDQIANGSITISNSKGSFTVNTSSIRNGIVTITAPNDRLHPAEYEAFSELLSDDHNEQTLVALSGYSGSLPITFTLGVDPCQECPAAGEMSKHNVIANGDYGCANDQTTYLETSGSYKGATYSVYKKDASGNFTIQYQFKTVSGSSAYEVVAATDGEHLRFFIPDKGEYRIKASCNGTEEWLSGIYTVKGYSDWTTIGNLSYCTTDLAGKVLKIQNSEYKVKYTLYRNGVIYQNGNYNVTGVTNNGTDEIDISTITQPGRYTVVAQREGCTQTKTVGGQLVITNGATRNLVSTPVTATSGGATCASNSYIIGIDSYAAGVTYTLVYTDKNGSSVNVESYTPLKDGKSYQFKTPADKEGAYTISTNLACEIVNGEQEVTSPLAADVSLSVTNDGCMYTFSIDGLTDPNYVYNLYVEGETTSGGKQVIRGTKQGTGAKINFDPVKAIDKTVTFKAYAVPKDAAVGDNSCRVEVKGAVTVPGIPKSPIPNKSSYYFCGTAGADVDVTLADDVTADCILYQGNTQVQIQSVKIDAKTIRFSGVPAGDYTIVAKNIDGCVSDPSQRITVKGVQNNPELSHNIPANFCMSSDGNKHYTVTIVYADAPLNNATAYKFKVHIVPITAGKEFVVDSTDPLVSQVNSYTYKFDFVPEDYELTQGEVQIFIETTPPGQTELVCGSEVEKFEIQPQPEKPSGSITADQATDIFCEGDVAYLSASSAGASVSGKTWYYVYADNFVSGVSTPVKILKDNTEIYEFTVKIPDNANPANYDANGNYHRKYFIVAQDASQLGCNSDPWEYDMVIRPNNTTLRIDQSDPRWSLCEDSDPVTLTSYFYPGDGDFYIVGADSREELLILEKVNGSVVFDPKVFTPDGIKDTYNNGYDATFTPSIQQDANSVTYTIRYRQPWCPNTFYVDGKMTVNKKRDIGEYGIYADDCYCTNDLITVTGYPNTVLNEYGYARLLCEGILEKDQPEDDGLEYSYTFSPVLRYRGNSNGKTIEFTFEYKDGATGCVYTVKKQSVLYQPVADEIYFTIGGVPEGKNFQGGYSEDYFCPDDKVEHELTPYVYQYQVYDDGASKLSYQSATNASNIVNYFAPDNRDYGASSVDVTTLHTIYQTNGKWQDGSSSLISAGGEVTFQPEWAATPTPFKLKTGTPDGLKVKVSAELVVTDAGGTLTATQSFSVTCYSYYQFVDSATATSEYISSVDVNPAILQKYDAYEYKISVPLTDYTDPDGTSYYYYFNAAPYIKVKLDDGTVVDSGSGYDEKKIQYYFLDVSEIGNGNEGLIHLHVDNGSKCRNNQNDQCRADTERPVRVKRTLEHNMQSSYCAYDKTEVRVILNYPSKPIIGETTVADAIANDQIMGNLTSTVYNYDYEGVSGVSTITVQKIVDADGNAMTGTIHTFTVSSTEGSAKPIISYDNNGIGSVAFDFTDDGTQPVSFTWNPETGAQGAGKYHFVWTFVSGSKGECTMTKEWDVFLVNRSDPFAIWHGKSWSNASTGEIATYPTTWADVEKTPDGSVQKAVNEKSWFDGDPLTIKTDRTPAISLCWKSKYEDGDSESSNVISFMPTQLIGTEVPGTFWIQELKDENGVDRDYPKTEPVGGLLKDTINHMWKVCSENYPGSQYISDYAIYTNTLDPEVSDYRILYYVGCGEPFSRRIKVDNGSSVTVAVDNESNGYVCTSGTETDTELGITRAVENPYAVVHAKGTAVKNGKFSTGAQIAGLLYDPVADSLATVAAGRIWNNTQASVPAVLRGIAKTFDNVGQVAYLDFEKYRAEVKGVDKYGLTIYYEYTAGNGGCVYRASEYVTLVDFADVTFSVSNNNGSSIEKRLFCSNDVEDYALATTHPKIRDSQYVPGDGWFEITMQGASSGKSFGLYFQANGSTDKVKVSDADITKYIYNDNQGTFYFRPGELSPGIYTINYIFKSDVQTYGGCFKSQYKQYFVAPSHEYDREDSV